MILADQIITTTSPNSDSQSKSLIKSLSWRIIGTMDTIVISWILTGTLTVALSIGFIELFTKFFLYYGHERLWNKIKWK
jgi:uncharacterized membrane protein